MKPTLALRSFLPIGAALGLALIPSSAHAATIIYQDDFSGANNTNLSGTAPDIKPGAQTWSGSTLSFDADGSVDNDGGGRGAWLPFIPATGNIYQLSGTINVAGGSWITLGFAERNPNNHFNTTTASGADPYGSAVVAPGGAVTFFVGEGLSGSSDHTGINGVNQIDITLDATNASSTLWTMAFKLNGTQVVAPSTVLQSATFEGTGSFSNIAFVGFSADNTAAGQIDNFSLSIIPEPSTALLGGIGMLALLRRRR